ncbi:hypothetical protein ACOSQ2_031389 [Xanthoceras sorbifolium]
MRCSPNLQKDRSECIPIHLFCSHNLPTKHRFNFLSPIAFNLLSSFILGVSSLKDSFSQSFDISSAFIIEKLGAILATPIKDEETGPKVAAYFHSKSTTREPYKKRPLILYYN